MTQATYGDALLHVKNLSVEESPINLTELDIIADPTDPLSLSTVLSTAGTKRSKYTIEGICTFFELEALRIYFKEKSSNQLLIYMEQETIVDQYCIIQDFKWEAQVEARRIKVSMTLIEAEEPDPEES